MLHFVPALDPLPVRENLEAAFSRLERTNEGCFRNLQFGVYEARLLRPQNYRVPKDPSLVRSSIEKAAPKCSLTGREGVESWHKVQHYRETEERAR